MNHIYSETLDNFLTYVYDKIHIRRYVSPDPLQMLYNYDDPQDVEVVALISSSYAYGRVAQILNTLEKILTPMGKHPAEFLINSERKDLEILFSGIKHRFTTTEETIEFLYATGELLRKYNSMENILCSDKSTTLRQKQKKLVDTILSCGSFNARTLLPDPGQTSAMKRLNLMFRWLVRKDDVDVGIWSCIKPSELEVPLDTHLFRVTKILGLTSNNQANHKTAIEITENLKKYDPEDPVKFDFSLTRFGINPGFNYVDFMNELDRFQ
ncbi:MAG: TIGR02757 family protein [Deltaproteobacteria bacterium]|nr:TIGR02757 family protein [Deltaproteobacteria bacterium]